MSQPFHVLGPLRHRCTGCGGCCHAVVVFVSSDEAERVRGFAADAGLPDPVDGDKLRFEAGRCPFQGDDELCRIHREHGLEAKPLLGQQYPLVLTRTERGLRAGVDPGCYDAWESWERGPLLEARAGAVERRNFSPKAQRQEEQLLDLLETPGLSLSRLAVLLCEERPLQPGGLPPGFARRLLERLRAVQLSAMLSHEASGAMLCRVLQPALRHAEGLDPAAPPPWPALAPAQEAFALELLRRTLWLRLVPGLSQPGAVAVLWLAGAVISAWHDPSPRGYGRALAAWARAVRSPVLLEAIAPDPGALVTLATGP
jgi:Fe-S-cluster containining protein